MKLWIAVILLMAGSVAAWAQRSPLRPAYRIEKVDLAPANTCGNVGTLETQNFSGRVIRSSYSKGPIKSFALTQENGARRNIMVDWSYLEKQDEGLPGDLRIVLGMGRKIKVAAYKCNDLRVLKSLTVL